MTADRIKSRYCQAGKILRIDLSKNKVDVESTAKYSEMFLGGRGTNQWILLNEVHPKVKALDPDNYLIFGAGRLAGTLTPGACRLNIDSKNVFTGGIGSSNIGGHFASEMKFAGFDHIVIKGKAKRPVYILIKDDRIEIADAMHLWGKTTSGMEITLKESLGEEDIPILGIGPAGENLVSAACILSNTWRAAARCGLGAIMGSKNLKAIVVKGSKAIKVGDPMRFMQSVDKAFRDILKLESVKKKGEHGTIIALSAINEVCNMPYRNFQDDYVSKNEMDSLLPEIFINMAGKQNIACFACPIHCQHLFRIPEGPYAGELSMNLQINSVWDFGSMVGVSYAPAIIKAHALCHQYGLDMDNSAAAIAWAFECYQRGIINKKTTEGLELNWGDYKVVLELLEQLAYRRGFGNLLAEGCKKASEQIGKISEKYAMHIKGQDLVEPIRSCKGWGLGVVVASRGGTHLRGAPQTEFRKISREDGEKMFGVSTAGNPTTYEGKAKLVVYYERLHAILDSLGVCHFTSNWSGAGLLSPENYSEILSGALGEEVSAEELMKLGERIHSVEKVFNLLHTDFDRKDDYPPQRFMDEPIKHGPYKGERLEKQDFEKMLDEYYELHGWEKKTSFPREDTLKSLGLSRVAELLKKRGKLGK
jgi:aldehyde:ferredoxin oxidoreductase